MELTYRYIPLSFHSKKSHKKKKVESDDDDDSDSDDSEAEKGDEEQWVEVNKSKISIIKKL